MKRINLSRFNDRSLTVKNRSKINLQIFIQIAKLGYKRCRPNSFELKIFDNRTFYQIFSRSSRRNIFD